MPTDVWVRGRGDGPAADVPDPVRCKPLKATGDSALQITPMNRVAIITWMRLRGANAFVSRDGLAFQTEGRKLRTAVIGDWVVQTWDGKYYTLPPEMFDRMFQTRKATP